MKHYEWVSALVGCAGLLVIIGTAVFCPRLDELKPTEETTLFPEEWLQPVVIEEETVETIRGIDYTYLSAMPCDIALDIEKRPESPSEVTVEDFTEEVLTEAETEEIHEEVVNEQETIEESTEDRVLEETAEPDGYRVAGEGSVEAAPDDVPEPVAEPTTVETVPVTAAPVQDEPVHEVHEMGLEDTLRAELDAAGIGWWYPYAYAQIQQESHWNPGAVSADGKDYGLLQYRLQFWSGPGDIMDPYAQIRKYVGQVKARIDAGLSVEEIISRHMMSDYCSEINWTYVNDVLRWMNK